jgi:hypothetical protein
MHTFWDSIFGLGSRVRAKFPLRLPCSVVVQPLLNFVIKNPAYVLYGCTVPSIIPGAALITDGFSSCNVWYSYVIDTNIFFFHVSHSFLSVFADFCFVHAWNAIISF